MSRGRLHPSLWWLTAWKAAFSKAKLSTGWFVWSVKSAQVSSSCSISFLTWSELTTLLHSTDSNRNRVSFTHPSAPYPTVTPITSPTDRATHWPRLILQQFWIFWLSGLRYVPFAEESITVYLPVSSWRMVQWTLLAALMVLGKHMVQVDLRPMHTSWDFRLSVWLFSSQRILLQFMKWLKWFSECLFVLWMLIWKNLLTNLRGKLPFFGTEIYWLSPCDFRPTAFKEIKNLQIPDRLADL